MTGPAHPPQEDRQLPRGLPPRAGCSATRAARRSPRAVHHLHRVLDDHEPAAPRTSATRAPTATTGSDLPPGPGDGGRVQPDRRGRLRERARQPRVHRHALRRAGLRRRHDRDRDHGARRQAGSASEPELGVVHVQSTARKNVGEQERPSCSPTSARCRSGSTTMSAKLARGRGARRARRRARSSCRRYDPHARLRRLAHLSSNADTYFEDFRRATRIEHSRGRTMTERAHLPDRHARQHQPGALQPVHDRPRPEAVRRRQADRLRRHPVHALPRPVVPRRRRQRLGDIVYKTGRHSAPLFAGDTVFAATEILGKRDLPGRPDLGCSTPCAATSSSGPGQRAAGERGAAGLEEGRRSSSWSASSS